MKRLKTIFNLSFQSRAIMVLFLIPWQK